MPCSMALLFSFRKGFEVKQNTSIYSAPKVFSILFAQEPNINFGGNNALDFVYLSV